MLAGANADEKSAEALVLGARESRVHLKNEEGKGRTKEGKKSSVFAGIKRQKSLCDKELAVLGRSGTPIGDRSVEVQVIR